MNADSPGVLDEAWAAAEAALPEGWRLNECWGFYENDDTGATGYSADAVGPWPGKCSMGHDHGTRVVSGSGPTPAAALHALAAALAPEASREEGGA